MMEYAVEGDTLTPEEFEAGEWAPVLKAQDRFEKSPYGDNAKSTPCETQAGSDGRKTHGAEQVKRAESAGVEETRTVSQDASHGFQGCVQAPELGLECGDSERTRMCTERSTAYKECDSHGRGPCAGQWYEQHVDGEHAVYESQWGICDCEDAQAE
ncbi:hypothetical protein MTO96_049749 [Rhipicephalus appendiculatus]